MIKIETPISNKQSLNIIYQGSHWSIRSKLRADCLADLLPFKGKFKLKEEDFPVKITYHFKWATRAFDSSNCALLVKTYEDGLKKIGLLPDDNIKFVRQSNIISSKKKEGMDELEITIEKFDDIMI